MIENQGNPDTRQIRRFGAGMILFGLVLAGASLWRGQPGRAAVLAASAGLLGSLTALVPEPAGRMIFRAWMGAARPIGTCVSFLVLGSVYFGFLTPLAAAMKLSGRDPLRLKRPPEGTCWNDFRENQETSALEKLY